MAAAKRALKVAFEVDDLTKQEAQELADLLWWTATAWCDRTDHDLDHAFTVGHDLKGWEDSVVDIRFDGIRKDQASY